MGKQKIGWDPESVYEDWKASKLTQEAYCKREGIAYGSFKNKTYKQRRKCCEKAQVPVSGQFNVVSLSEEIETVLQPYCEISFSGRHKVSFSDKASMAGLKSLIGDLIQL